MSHLFIAHSSADAAHVDRVAKSVEARGFRCWFYERDAKPGESYLEAEGKAITQAEVVLFFATETSINSFEVRKELQYSHKRKKRLLTIMLDPCTQKTIDHDHELGLILGTSVQVTTENTAALGLVDAVVERLIQWDVARVPSKDPEEVAPATSTVPEINWVSDGMQVQVEMLSSFVFGTKVIDQFIRNRQQYFICANKGLGKTLLLRFKRSQTHATLVDDHSEEKRGVVLIPEDSPFLDQLSDVPTLSQEKEKSFLADLRNSRRLWSFSLRLSCVSHCAYVFEKVPKLFSKSLPKNLVEWITSSRVPPTQIYKHLLSQPHGELHKLLDTSENALDALYRAIQNGVKIFIDRVDESTSDLCRAAWVNMQAGLIEASWACMNANNHVKIFASIREEAYVNYESATKPNLHSAVVTIRYSKDELRQMLDRLSAIYEGSQGFQDFIGFADVKSNHSGVVEDSFDYLHRHTLGRPRDLVIVCAELSRHSVFGDERVFRETVKQVGADLVNSSLFNEMSVFLDCLRDVDSRRCFFSLIPCNVLSRQELVEISSKLNGIDSAFFGELQTAGNILSHPFCELWSCGLLGVVQQQDVDGNPTQRFKQRYDRSESSGHALPSGEYYLLHPSLQAALHRSRDGAGYNVLRGVVIGHGNAWLPHYDLSIRFQRSVQEIEEFSMRQEALQLLPFILAGMNHDRVVQTFIDESISVEAQNLLGKLERANYDDAYYAMQEILEFHR